jgi:uncharacterized membrane protein YkvA (DUF1232 family)
MAAMQGGGKYWQVLQVLRQGLGKAERLVRNPKEILGVLTAAERGLDQIPAGPFTPMVGDAKTLLRLLRAYAGGEYRQVSGKNIALAVAGMLYLASPLDMIPDILPGGFADDAAVIGFILKKIRTELVAFEAWERAQDQGQAPEEGQGSQEG